MNKELNFKDQYLLTLEYYEDIIITTMDVKGYKKEVENV